MKILICEDDRVLAAQMGRYLSHNGYEILLCHELDQVWDRLYAGANLFLLDVHIGRETTFELCQFVHDVLQVPVLLLSGDVEEASILEGYEREAAEYIEKPVRPAVLLAKVRAALKNRDHPVCLGGYVLDVKESLLKGPDGSWLLSGAECALLEKLMAASPSIVSKERLKNGVSPDGSDATLRTRLSELRHHLPPTFHIQAVWDKGYRLMAGESQ